MKYKLKIGDRVETKSLNSNDYLIGTITKINDGGYKYRVDFNNGDWVLRLEDELQLIPNTKSKWKYTRKELVEKYKKEKGYYYDDWFVDLLATISKEKESQRIMMEQVDKEEVERDGWFNCTKCGIEFYCGHEITESGALCDNCFYGLIVKTHPKQDKPVERECPKCFGEGDILKSEDGGVVFDVCPKCKGARYIKIKDTKPVCEHEFVDYCFHCIKCGELRLSPPKKDKPVEHCKRCGGKWELNKNGLCLSCHYELSNPIEDTNKTSLEVPSKLKSLKLMAIPTTGNLANALEKVHKKQSEIIDYLTLISLDKK